MKTPLYSILVKTHHAQRAKIRPFMQDIGLSIGQPKVLNYLIDHPSASQKDIAFACDIEPATVSKLLDNMEEKDLLIRKSSSFDRRSFCVEITPKGKQKQEAWSLHCKHVEKEALANFSEEEKQQLSEYLCRMYKNLTDRDIE